MAKNKNEKKIGKTVLCIVAYIVFAYGSAFFGFLGPTFWVLMAAPAAVLCAFPTVYLMQMYRRTGVLTAVAVIWALLLLVSGEVWTPIIVVYIIAVGIIADVIRSAVGNASLKAIRFSYPVMALLLFGQLLTLWIKTDTYLSMAAEEMGSETYAAGLQAWATPLGLIGAVVIIFICGIIGERIAEKLWKNQLSDMN